MPAFLAATDADIARAANALQAGQLVIFPTETVYGLGADATNGPALARIFTAKGRPAFNPLIIHGAEAASLYPLAVFDQRAEALAEAFWPGPLTLVLPRAAACPVSDLATAGLPSIALRVPAHPVARALLRAAACPVAAPSANPSGLLSPTAAIHIKPDIAAVAAAVLAGGRSAIGLESTVLDLTSTVPCILRPGAVTAEQLMGVIGPLAEADPARPIRSPGQSLRHYAPTRPLRLEATLADDTEGFLLFGPELGLRGGALRLNLSAEGNLEQAAANLFAMLHQLDSAPHIRAIAVAPIPALGLGCAIRDRLARAAAGSNNDNLI